MRLVFFVEGDDDQRFIERIVIPHVKDGYELIKIQKTASFRPNDICKLIKRFQASGWNYLFLVDKDNCRCFSQKRSIVTNKWTAVELSRVVVVDQEIESWYIAGLQALTAIEVGFTLPKKTETFTKEHLQRLVSTKFPTATDLSIKFLNSYSIETAKERSASLNYLIEKVKQ